MACIHGAALKRWHACKQNGNGRRCRRSCCSICGRGARGGQRCKRTRCARCCRTPTSRSFGLRATGPWPSCACLLPLSRSAARPQPRVLLLSRVLLLFAGPRTAVPAAAAAAAVQGLYAMHASRPTRRRGPATDARLGGAAWHPTCGIRCRTRTRLECCSDTAGTRSPVAACRAFCLPLPAPCTPGQGAV